MPPHGTMMKIAVHVTGSPYSQQSNLTALRFCQAVIQEGKQLSRVFFSGDGVHSATNLAIAPQDEADLYAEWQELALKHDVDLVVCISACLRRGIINEEEAQRYEKTNHNLKQGFVLSGLGQLVEASIECDRLVTFGS